MENNVIAEHAIKNSHEFDWDDPKILNKEGHVQKRLFAESTFIKKFKERTINKQKETEMWQSTYDTLLPYICKFETSFQTLPPVRSVKLPSVRRLSDVHYKLHIGCGQLDRRH